MAKNIIDYDGYSVPDPPGTTPSPRPQVNLQISVPGAKKKKRKRKGYSDETIKSRLTSYSGQRVKVE